MLTSADLTGQRRATQRDGWRWQHVPVRSTGATQLPCPTHLRVDDAWHPAVTTTALHTTCWQQAAPWEGACWRLPDSTARTLGRGSPLPAAATAAARSRATHRRAVCASRAIISWAVAGRAVAGRASGPIAVRGSVGPRGAATRCRGSSVRSRAPTVPPAGNSEAGQGQTNKQTDRGKHSADVRRLTATPAVPSQALLGFLCQIEEE